MNYFPGNTARWKELMNIIKDHGNGFVALDIALSDLAEKATFVQEFTDIMRQHRGVQFADGLMVFTPTDSIAVIVALGDDAEAQELGVHGYRDIHGDRFFCVEMFQTCDTQKREQTMAYITRRVLELAPSTA